MSTHDVQKFWQIFRVKSTIAFCNPFSRCALSHLRVVIYVGHKQTKIKTVRRNLVSLTVKVKVRLELTVCQNCGVGGV